MPSAQAAPALDSSRMAASIGLVCRRLWFIVSLV
jgi:hypothetical protein